MVDILLAVLAARSVSFGMDLGGGNGVGAGGAMPQKGAMIFGTMGILEYKIKSRFNPVSVPVLALAETRVRACTTEIQLNDPRRVGTSKQKSPLQSGAIIRGDID
jgi:hypothetical protein